jgi:flagellar basal-body rod protein FlgF
MRPGTSSRTGNPFDVYPEDGAFLTVKLPSGEIAFTRDGRLSLDAEGRLVSQGRLVLSKSGDPIVVPPNLSPAGNLDETPSIDTEGRVRSGEVVVGELALVKLDGPADRVGPSLLIPAGGGQAIPVDAHLRMGEIDTGNASALDSTIALVSAQRAYDASMQAIQTYNQMRDRSNQLGRVS